jgi:hypothetical protein
MAKIRSLLGYSWAVLALPLVLATFFGMSKFSESLVNATGLKVSPKYVGGNPLGRPLWHDSGQWQTVIHAPAFPALIGESAEGFVQVDWLAATDKTDQEKVIGKVPPVIDEEIDYNLDGRPEFQVHLNTACRRAVLTSHSDLVIGNPEVFKFHHGWSVRVPVRNPRVPR